MAAEIISDPAPLAYHEQSWGDWISGTKAELQALGLGVGVPFPGEPNGPRRLLNVVDPRGFRTKIRCGEASNPPRYSAHIWFPGRDQPRSGPTSVFAPGVMKEESCRSDDYIGTESALVDAGLVQAHQFPGKPGMRKTRVKIFADGSIPTGGPTAKCMSQADQAGAKTIFMVAGKKYCVSVRLDHAAGEARFAAMRQEDAEWQQRMRALPRPPRLGGGDGVDPARQIVGATAKVIPFPRARAVTTRLLGKPMQKKTFGDDLGAALDDILDIDTKRTAYIACLKLIGEAIASQGA